MWSHAPPHPLFLQINGRLFAIISERGEVLFTSRPQSEIDGTILRTLEARNQGAEDQLWIISRQIGRIYAYKLPRGAINSRPLPPMAVSELQSLNIRECQLCALRSKLKSSIGALTPRQSIEFSIPFWALVTAVLLFIALLNRPALRLRPDAHRTLCRQCGYDLRAGHDRCPECGAAWER
jgi:hypothetical protein